MSKIVITKELSYGNLETEVQPPNTAVVHACKEPCHRRALGYTGRISRDHPHYLALEKGRHLYLNMIDPPVPLFQPESFALFFDFIDKHLQHRPIHIHCNQGRSRAPSLTMLVMAKRLATLPNESYEAARTEFEKHYPYNPGAGITQFLEEHWEHLGQQPLAP